MRLLLLAMLGVLPSSFLALWHAAGEQQDELSEVSAKAQREAQLAAAGQKRIVDGARQLLLALSTVPAIRDHDETQCGPMLRRLADEFQVYTVLGVAGPEGRIWCSSAQPGTDISMRPGYRQAVETRAFAIGGYVVGRVTGRRTLHFTLPMYDGDGRLLGIVTAGLDLERLAADLGGSPLAPGSTLTLVGPYGHVLVDLPSGRRVGELLPPPLRKVVEVAEPALLDLEWTSGRRQIVGVVPIAAQPGAPFVVAVGIDHEQALAGAYRRGLWVLAVSAATLAAALLGAWWFAVRFIRQPIARLTTVVESWRRGNIQARAGVIEAGTEIAQLGRAFDDMAEAVAKRKKRLRDALESTTDSVWAIDKAWLITFINGRGRAQLDGRELVGEHFWVAFPDLVGSPVSVAFQTAMDERAPTQVTFFNEAVGGHLEANVFPSSNGGIVTFIRNVTEQVRAQEELRRLAYQDGLTGLPNRRSFWELTARALETGEPIAVVLLDLDGFKHVNDTLGHAAGDELLRAAAARLTQALGSQGTLARLGGDEFVALLAGLAAASSAEATAERMLGSLDDGHFVVQGHILRIAASAGIVITSAGDRNGPEKLLANADLALYGAKAAGGGSVRTYTELDREEYEARRRLEEEVEQAALRGEFELHYQPQVCLRDGALTGAEALLRWRHPERGLLTPAVFLETLEGSRHARTVGSWIIHEACRQAAAWRQAGFDLRVGVNLFGEQLVAGDLVEVVEAALRSAGLPHEALEIELTENIALQQQPDMLMPLRVLLDRGVGIAFDDFGTGFASLTALKDFPVTRLKIDRSFVTKLAPGNHDAAIVESVLTLASSLGLEVIAEGIETGAQEAFLASHGCHEGQGYRYGKPTNAETFLTAAIASRQVMVPQTQSHLRVVQSSGITGGR
jgi:diguanylate cyclase (GGDEF)-like protein